MSEKLTLARIKKNGQQFEISVDPDKALQYKNDGSVDLREVLLADNIFMDVHRGLIASSEDLAKNFSSADVNVVADIILKKGEIQLTSDHRSHEREVLKKGLIEMIHRQAVDPKTGYPHPISRIEAALVEGKVHVDYNKSIADQLEKVIVALRPIIPLSIEKKRLSVIIGSTFIGKANSLVRSKKLISEDWRNDGSWAAVIELPAGMIPDFIDQLNSITHGQAQVEKVE
jgi:ribosome maturation protein SDO1